MGMATELVVEQELERKRIVTGPEIRSLGDMIKAIDAMDAPPATLAEKLEFIEEWRKKELGYHAKREKGVMAAQMITVAEIDSIIRTRKFRKDERYSPKRSGPGYTTKQRGGESFYGLAPDVVSLNTAGRLCFGKELQRAFGLDGFSFLEIIDRVAEHKVIRFVFSCDPVPGARKIHLGKKQSITIERITKRHQLRIGVYRIHEVSEAPLTLDVDVSKRVGFIAFAHNSSRNRRATVHA